MKTFAFLTAGTVGVVLALTWYWISGPERNVQNQSFTPEGLRVVLVDFPSDPNIVTYDPDRLSSDDLDAFARKLCHIGVKDISERTTTLLDKLRRHNRATITCH